MKNLLRNLTWSIFMLLATQTVFAQNFNLQLRSSMEFPGQTLANVCGYAQNGREYALLGASQGLIIVDVTDPANPINIVQIPGPNNLWKEIKTYSHYAYITSEGGEGLQIVDLSSLPSPILNSHYYTGLGQFPDPSAELDRIHSLHIDVTKGFLYAHGGDLFSGSSKVFDLNSDPYNPTYAGVFNALGYVHDGYADNDTLYACHIYTGTLSITDMSDKSNPKLLGTVQTPGKFTHNSWLLDDHKHILTTDEDTPSFVTSYDISDPQDIKELDRFSTNNGSNSIGHNTHVRDDWALTSWYTDGVVITDAHKPDNLVITGLYDTWPGTGPSFDGCWGVFPFLPSGTVVASNIPTTDGGVGKLFVLTPEYKRACYLEGFIKSSCTGLPFKEATIEVNSGNAWVNTTSNNNGIFKTGQVEAGIFVVTVSGPGYIPQTFNVNLQPGQVTELDVTLEPTSAFDIIGTVVDAVTQAPIANAPVILSNGTASYDLQTNASGQFNLDCIIGGDYQVVAASWGYLPAAVTFNADGNVIVELERGYYDDFGLNLGWTSASNGATAGFWERGEPNGTILQNTASNPDFDIDFDGNNECYVTGNGGGNAGSDDVDNGSVILTSPLMELADYQDAVLSFWYWFFNAGGQGNPPPPLNDLLEVRVTSNGQTVTVFTENLSASEWRFSGEISLKNFITLSDDVKVEFVASDINPGHIVEAAVDVFKVVPGAPIVGINSEIDASALVSVMPNPSATSFAIRYEWPTAENPTLEVRNLLGQVVMTQRLGANTGIVNCGNDWPTGVYVATLRDNERQSASIKMVKQ